MANTSVKTFKSTDPGAPVLSSAIGTLIAVLDACLVNGYNLMTASSVVVSGGVATATFASAHGFSKNRVVLVAGAGTSGINGEQRVTAVTTNSLSWAAPGIADGTIGGTITVKMAPIGFTKEFSGTNLAAYRSSDLASSSRCYLRVDDSAVQNARVLSYESMTDVNTGTNPMPTAVQLAGGAYLYKSNAADNTARRWMLVGDGRLFHFWWFNGSYFHSMSFGEFISWRPGDAFNTILAAQVASNSYTGSLVYCTSTNNNYATSYGGGVTVQRGNDQLAVSVLTGFTSLVFSTNNGSGVAGISGSAAMAYPSDVTGGFELYPVYVRTNLSTQNSSKRGIMPGVYHSSTDMSAFDEQEIGGIPSNPGALFLSWPIQSGSSIGRAQIDMIGPWR